jgi:hypothetical protein
MWRHVLEVNVTSQFLSASMLNVGHVRLKCCRTGAIYEMSTRKALAAGVPLLAAAFTAGTAAAADLSWNSGYTAHYGSAAVVRSGTADVYEFVGQSPFYVRRWWREPWAHRHYYPASDRIPVVGRREVLPKQPAPPPEDYFRYWSTPPGYSEEPPRIMRFDPGSTK